MNNQMYYRQSEYTENVLKNNIGKKITVYMSFSDSVEYRDKIFTGTLIDSGKDYILLKEEITNKNHLLWSVYIDYLIFE